MIEPQRAVSACDTRGHDKSRFILVIFGVVSYPSGSEIVAQGRT